MRLIRNTAVTMIVPATLILSVGVSGQDSQEDPQSRRDCVARLICQRHETSREAGHNCYECR